MGNVTIKSPVGSWCRIVRLLWLIPLLVLILSVAGIGALFLRSDTVEFQPRLPQIRQMLEAQRKASPWLPPVLIQCLRIEGDSDHFTARQLLVQHGLDQTRALHRHAHTWFWSWSLQRHFTQDERDLLYCAVLNDGRGNKGIHHLSQRMHGANIDQLDDRQLAALAVASGAPSYWLRDQARLDMASEDLMRRVFDGPPGR